MPKRQVSAGKLGMTQFKRQDVGLRLGTYLVEDKLPALPRTFGHVTNFNPALPMFGNDKHSDCVMVGAAHEDIIVHHASGRPIPRHTDDSVLKNYFLLTGGKDDGLDPVETAKYRQDSGLVDADGVAHKIAAYTLIDSLDELGMATYLFGAAGAGFFLPTNAEAQFDAGHVWDDTSGAPDRKRGHYIVCCGRNSRGLWVFSTWGDLQAATDRWIKRYFVGGLAYFSEEYLTAEGKSPESFDGARLARDLLAVKHMPHTS